MTEQRYVREPARPVTRAAMHRERQAREREAQLRAQAMQKPSPRPTSGRGGSR